MTKLKQNTVKALRILLTVVAFCRPERYVFTIVTKATNIRGEI